MKKMSVIRLLCFIGILIFGWYFYKGIASEKNAVNYLKAIDKVYNSDIIGMSLVVLKSSDLHGKDVEIHLSAVGNKENNFSNDSEEGVRLWAAKQLFSSIKSLKVVREGSPELLEPKENEYYMIHTNHDFSVGSHIYYLSLFVNPKNYHIYLPKEYYEPQKLIDFSAIYVEYEPNEVTKKLIDDIVIL